MKLIPVLFACILFTVQSFCQVPDTICGHKVYRDKDAGILGWYKPEIPGATFDKVVRLASEYIKSGCPVEPSSGKEVFFTHCSILRDKANEKEYQAGLTGSKWPHNPAGLFAGMVKSLAVDFYMYSGDTAYIGKVKSMLDYQLANGTTPANYAWPNCPYSSSDPGDQKFEGSGMFQQKFTNENIAFYRLAGDGKFGMQPDKVGELGYGYLLFYEITNDQKYLEAALNCADALAWHVRDVPTEWYKRVGEPLKSPWPFRVDARTGENLEDYCANVVEPVKLFNELARIKTKISLSNQREKSYFKAKEIAWKWMFSLKGPMKTYIWKGYFEDVFFDGENITRVNNLPLEAARYFIKHPEVNPNFKNDVPALIWFVKSVFGVENLPAICEQSGTFFPLGSHTARFASVCALWYEQTGEEWFKDQAYRHFNLAAYCTETDGLVRTGPFWGAEVWFTDGYSDYIKHFMEGLAAIPEWVPAENHLLKSSSTVQKIIYTTNKVSFTTFDNQSEVVLRLVSKPKSVIVSGKSINQLNQAGGDGYEWKALEKGGVLKLKYSNGSEVGIEL
jgi:hypothetical protein